LALTSSYFFLIFSHLNRIVFKPALLFWRIYEKNFPERSHIKAPEGIRWDALCQLLWKLWSPTWSFGETTFRRTATSFQNPDFVDVVIHSYRHRFGNAEGDPHYPAIEGQLSVQPNIQVPTIVIQGVNDGVNPHRRSEGHDRYFSGRYERRLFDNVGHNPPQESPKPFAQAVLDLCNRRSE
jgi:pimeloyl-ACP methyl ester carboxylesterase